MSPPEIKDADFNVFNFIHDRRGSFKQTLKSIVHGVSVWTIKILRIDLSCTTFLAFVGQDKGR